MPKPGRTYNFPGISSQIELDHYAPGGGDPSSGFSLQWVQCSNSTSRRLTNDWLAPTKAEQPRQYDSVTLLRSGDRIRQNRGFSSCSTMMRLGTAQKISDRCPAKWVKLLLMRQDSGPPISSFAKELQVHCQRRRSGKKIHDDLIEYKGQA